MTIELTLIVLKTRQVEVAKDFYSNLGLVFQQEKHGQGPLHFSATVNGVVIEIYPTSKDFNIESLRLGFAVNKLEEIMEKLAKENHVVVSNARQTSFGYSAVVKDPDGRVVELYQK